jgi:hypothetical protein
MKSILPGLFILTLISCSSGNNGNKDKAYFADLLNEVDQLKLVFFNKGDTLLQVITGQEQLDAYKEVINGKIDPKHKLTCDSTGKMVFFSKGKVVLDAWFSTKATGSKFPTDCVTYSIQSDVFCTKFTYRSGMAVDDYYYKLRSNANRMANKD